ncbi:hypothetical protein OS493_035734 [Desmophyllum pertusum]|uniref:Uncharacterized protein n=1 Tax=Desmophyllum pertusum TaxID=174260 RepID=A0A9X0D8G5_9CNID|nr:hypothetical protein OS493_035734 [Desmophyllum pertusum]
MRGMKKLTVFSRKVISKKGSRLDLRAPTLKQNWNFPSLGKDGVGGMHGVPGPIVEVSADVSEGYLNMLTNGGNGNKGRDGEKGKSGEDGDKIEVRFLKFSQM